jgi:hypothetical protein
MLNRTRSRTISSIYGYNGGLGPTAKWDGEPLGVNCGYGAHFGDWERMTVLVETTPGTRTVKLKAVMGELHGDEVVFRERNTIAPVEQFSRNEVYAAWHSHATYPDVGIHRYGIDFTSTRGSPGTRAKRSRRFTSGSVTCARKPAIRSVTGPIGSISTAIGVRGWSAMTVRW